ncbi:Ig-like domain-containing protein, partial [Emticicia aquatilis]|uniref:Ig-like domain-containing protein n=1 Tax=Emticicia aquatilis TaxID=1537369 RepID=UPI001663BED8
MLALLISTTIIKGQAPTVTTDIGIPSGGNPNARGIAFGNGFYISILSVGKIYKATDGEAWVKVQGNPTGTFNGVAFGAGIFVIAGTNGQILSSTDGLTWTSRNSGTTEYFNDIRYIQSAFYAVGNNATVKKSTDGITWTTVTLGVGNAGDQLRNITYGNGTFAIGLTNVANHAYVYRSTTGASNSWSYQLVQNSIFMNKVQYLKDKFYVFTSSTTIFSSTDAITWTNASSSIVVTLPNATTTTITSPNQAFEGIYDGTKFYFFGNSSYHGSNGIYSSTDGINFTLEPKTAYLTGLAGSAYLNSKYFQFGNEGIISSTNGTTYKFPNGSYSALAYSGTSYVGVGTNGRGQIFSSPDFTTWTDRTPPNPKELYGVTHNGTKFLAVGRNTVLESTNDGVAWSEIATPAYNFNTVTFGNSKFVATGQNTNTSIGAIAYSTNGGVSWTSANTADNYYFKVKYVNGNFFALGTSNVPPYGAKIMQSADGITWTNITPTLSFSTYSFNDVVWDGTKYHFMGMEMDATFNIYVGFFSVSTSTITNPNSFINKGTIASPPANTVLGGAYGEGAFEYSNGHFVGIVNDLNGVLTPLSYVIYSNDGISWTPIAIDGFTNIGGATVSGSTFRFLGTGDGKITVSYCTPPTAYNVTGGGAYCSGSSGVVLGLSNSESGVTYQLKNGTSNSGSPVPGTGAAISFGNQTATGTYTVVATRTTGGCTTNMTGSQTVVINSPPSATITPTPNPVCQNATLNLSAPAGGTTYVWSGNGVVLANSNTTTAVPASIGTQTYGVTVTNANNCSATGTVSVTVNSTSAPTSPIATPSTLTTTGTTTLTASGCNSPFTITWYDAANSTVALPNNTPTISANKTFFAKCTGTNNCASSPSPNVSVTYNPCTPLISSPGNVDITWTGLINTDWNNACNWNPAWVPDMTNGRVIIPAVAKDPVINSGIASVKNIFINGTGANLTINSGATLTVVSDALNVLLVEAGGVLTNNGTINITNSDATAANKNAFQINNSTVDNYGTLNITSLQNNSLEITGTFNNKTNSSLIINASRGIIINDLSSIVNESGANMNLTSTNSTILLSNGGLTNTGIITSNGNIEKYNSSSLLNNACGILLVTGQYFNTGTTTNQGYIQINGTLHNTTLSTFSNSGVLKYDLLNVSSIITNNKMVVTNTCPIFALGGSNNYTVSGIFTDAAATTSAGTYTSTGNKFTANNTIPTGSQTLYAKVTDGICTFTVPFDFNNIKPTSVSISTTNTCVGTSITLSATCTSGTVTWYGSPAGTTQLGTGGTFSYIPSAGTGQSFYAACETTNCNSGRTITSNSINVYTVPSAPTVTLTSPSVVCSPATLNLTASGCTGTVTWSDNSTGTSLTLSAPGTYNVSATCSANGCTSVASTGNNGLVINASPLAPTGVSVSSTTICLGNSVSLSAACSSGVITWYGQLSGGTAIGTGSLLSVSPVSSRKYFVGCNNGVCESQRIATDFINVKLYNVEAVGVSPFQDSLWTVRTSDWSINRRIKPILTGKTITGINAISQNPADGKYYAILKVSAVSGRVLASIIPTTGVCTEIGNLGDNFSSLTFSTEGVCYAVTGDGATVPETLYKIDITNAQKTLLRALGNGADGEVIAYNYDDGFIYHWSGNGTVIYEKIDPVNLTITSIPIIGTTNGETFGAVYEGNGVFLTSNIGSSFNKFKINGEVTPAFGSNPDDLRGLAYIGTGISAPTITPPPTMVVCEPSTLTLTANGCGGVVTWSTGATGSTLTLSAAGTYSITATCTELTCTSDPSTAITGLEIKAKPAAPTITPPPSLSVCFPSTLTLTVSDCAGTVTWSQGGATGTSLTLSAVGTYSVSATCTVKECTSDASTLVNGLEIKAKPGVSTITPPNPQVVCFPSTLTLTASECAGTITWSPSAATGTSLTLSATGTYAISATCTVNGCTSDPSTSVNGLEIKAKPNAPTITPPVSISVCSPSSLTLSASGCAGTVTWSQGGSTGTSLTLSAVGTYSISATCTANGCTSDASATVNGLEIKAKPNSPTITPPTTLVVCSPSTLTLTASECAGTITWSPSAATGTSLTLSATGTYAISATCTVNGCTSDPSTSVNGLEIKAKPNAPTITPPVSISVCSPSSLTLSASGCAGTVTWSQGGSTGTSLTLSAVGTYSISATCTVNGCTSDASATVNGLEIKAKPNAPTITPPTTLVVCSPSTLTLTASGCAGTVTWSQGAATGTSLTLSATGTYAISATCTVNGCTSDPSTSVNGLEIKAKPNAPTITPPVSISVCSPSSLTLSASGCAGTVTWSQGGSTGTSLTLSAVGTYSISATCTANGCTSDASATVNGLEIKAKPNAPSITPPATLVVCSPSTLTLTASGCAGTVTWSQGAATGTSLTLSATGTYAISATCTVNGCTSNPSTSVNGLEIKAKPNAPTITPPVSISVCSPSSLTLSASGCAGTVTWSQGGSTGTSLTLSAVGTYSISATCTVNGCTSDASATVNGLEIKAKPNAPSITPPTTLVVCSPSSLTLTASGCAGTVTWSPSAATGTSLTLSAVGTYSISATCTVNGCTSDPSTSVNGLEIKATPIITATNTGPYTVGQTISLIGTGAVSYNWTGPNNFSSTLSTPTVPNALPVNGGVYTLSVIGLNGCSSIATTNVIVSGIDPCDPSRIVDYLYVKAGNPYQPLFPLTNGMVINQIPDQVSILVNPVCSSVTIESFEMNIQGPELNWNILQNVSPYALFDNFGLDVWGRNFKPGNYTLTVTGYAQDNKGGGVTYGPKIITFTVVGNLATINAPTLSKTDICAGNSVDVTFSTTGTFNGSNQFGVELSDSSGSFAAPILIGTTNTT